MIEQPIPTEQASAHDMSPQEAFVSLLMASARADGFVSAHEANSIEHIVSGMQLFRGHGHEQLRQIFATASERIKEYGARSAVQTAAAAVPKELRATTFAVAIDLLLSDGRFSPREERFADELRALLDIEQDTATKIVEVLRLKNAG